MRAWSTLRGVAQGLWDLLRGAMLRDRVVTTTDPALGLVITSRLGATGQVEEWIQLGGGGPAPSAALAHHRRKVLAEVQANQAALQALALAPSVAVGLAIAGWLGMELMLSELATTAAAARALWSGGLQDPAVWTHLATMAWGAVRPIVDAWVMARLVRWLKQAVVAWVSRRLRAELGQGL